jgi:hypothetical protein
MTPKLTSARRTPVNHSPHEDCTAHSGLNTRVTIQIAVSAFGTLLLGVLLNVAVGIRSDVNSSLAEMRGDVKVLGQKVDSLEWRLARIEGGR